MITTESIWKEYSSKLLFKNLSLKLTEGMRMGLVGPNGAGKSTLLKILLQTEFPDKGHVTISKFSTIGYLPQEIVAGSERNIIEETLSAYPEIANLEKRIHEISNKLSQHPNNSKMLTELSKLQERFDQMDGWNMEGKAKTILSGLGFKEKQFHKPFNTFSGGWRMRCYLAGILLKQPNYLFLDEPTNHLDLHAIIWMEEFLASWKGALIMISHDRNFLDKSINNILELRNGEATLYSGNYSSYLEKKEERKKHIEKRYTNQQKEIAQTERFIERFRSKNTKAKQVQSRIKKLEKLEIIGPIEKKLKNMNVKIPQPERGPLKVVDLQNIHKSFEDNLVYENLNLTIERGQKIALVGENGSGKSTLLKLLANVEKPTSGHVNFGPNIKSHYFAQHQLESLNLNLTIYDTIFSISQGWTESQIRTYLGSFLFTNDDVQNKVKVLSGGEKSRLALARLLIEPAQLLLLDEPTNHLDIQSRDVLENAMKYYNGTLVCISHDRHFLNSVTNLTIEIKNGNAKPYTGNYDYYIWKSKQNTNENQIKDKTKSTNKLNLHKEKKIKRNEYKKIQKNIIKLEDELNKINTQLKDEDISSDHEKLHSLNIAHNQIEIQYLDLIGKLDELEKLI